MGVVDTTVATILVSSVAALVTYGLNEKAKRRELRITQISDRRFKAYTEAKQRITNLLVILGSWKELMGTNDESRPLEKRVEDAIAACLVVVNDRDLFIRLCTIEGRKAAQEFESARLVLVSKAIERLTSVAEETETALYACRLLVLDEEVRQQIRRAERSLEAFMDKVFEGTITDESPESDAIEEELDGTLDLLAANFAKDFGGS